MAKIKKGKPPVVVRCLGCGREFPSKYSAKVHACKEESPR